MSGFRVVSIMAVLAFLAPAVSAEETVRVSGTGGAIGGLKLLGDSFEKKHPGVKVNVFPSMGSAGGIKAVAAGKLDLAISSRRIKDEEKDPGLVEERYVKTAFIFATSSANTTKGLTLSEIQDIYAGRITRWPGGNKIFLVIRPATDAFTDYLEKLSPGMKNAVELAMKRPGIFTGITDQDAADQIEKTSGSFGVTSYSLVASEKRKIKPLAVDGIFPVGKNGVNDKYPYFVTYYLVHMIDRNTGAVRNFINFIDSKEGVIILKSSGHIPIRKARGQP